MSTVCDPLTAMPCAPLAGARLERWPTALISSPTREPRAGLFWFVPILRTFGAPHGRLSARWREAPHDASQLVSAPRPDIPTAADDALGALYLAPAPPMPGAR